MADVAEIKKRQQVVCICKAIKLGKVRDAITKGASTVAEVNCATGAGSGDCGAVRCKPVIETELVKYFTEKTDISRKL